MFPWMVKSFVESDHPREEHGRFSETAQKHRGLLEEAKKLRSDAFNQAKSDAVEHHEHANSTAAGLHDRMNQIAWDNDNEDEQPFTDLESLIMEYDPTGTVNERMSSLKDIVVAAKQAMKAEQSDIISNTSQAQNKLELKEIIAGAKKAQEHLRTHAGHRREMAAIKSGENWKSIREIIEKGYPELAMSFPWMILKSGQFTESKHKRGNPKNAGQFSTSGGGGAKPKPRTSGKVSGPSRGISQPGKGKPPAAPYGVRPSLPANMPALPNKQTPPPLPGDTYQVSQPHLQTQQSAVQAGNAALQEAASGQANGPAKQAFAKALHAHYAAGIMALQKMANQKYGPGPKADAARKQAEQVFVGKIRAAWAKVNAPQGGAQPIATAPMQPKQTRIREFTRDQPPPLPRKSINSDVIIKSFDTFDLAVELPDEQPMWLRSKL